MTTRKSLIMVLLLMVIVCHVSTRPFQAGNILTGQGLKTRRPGQDDKCQEGRYYDDVTQHCDDCMPHCDRAPLFQPPTSCTAYCKKRSPDKHNCPEDRYYDDVTLNCDLCSPHCDRIPAEVPPDQCRDYCTRTRGKDGRRSSTTTIPPEVGPRRKTEGISPTAIALITIVCGAVVVITGSIWFCWKYRRPRQHKQITLEGSPMLLKRGVQENSPEVTSATVTATTAV
ncbi:uncharacterized protein LOC124150854 isoform X2 [Haliotis rufescens]|uniref:uncharacterized protein LOC124150854 isoform X2 n=1 Tax=Haliotis rufescens TaxID=6454 RepID=UPI00201E76C8|nr:uncharacterized protein LOC124150854 isoform X2 [Haliotis rufescens]